MRAHQAEFPVRMMCRVLGLSPSGYYAWLQRPPSARSLRDDELAVKLEAAWAENQRVYGRPGPHAELQEKGERIGEKRVGRLMRRLGIVGVSRCGRGPKTTYRNPDSRPAADLVDRDFDAEGDAEMAPTGA